MKTTSELFALLGASGPRQRHTKTYQLTMRSHRKSPANISLHTGPHISPSHRVNHYFPCCKIVVHQPKGWHDLTCLSKKIYRKKNHPRVCPQPGLLAVDWDDGVRMIGFRAPWKSVTSWRTVYVDRPERVENRFSLTSAEKLAARQAEAVPWQ